MHRQNHSIHRHILLGSVKQSTEVLFTSSWLVFKYRLLKSCSDRWRLFNFSWKRKQRTRRFSDDLIANAFEDAVSLEPWCLVNNSLDLHQQTRTASMLVRKRKVNRTTHTHTSTQSNRRSSVLTSVEVRTYLRSFVRCFWNKTWDDQLPNEEQRERKQT